MGLPPRLRSLGSLRGFSTLRRLTDTQETPPPTEVPAQFTTEADQLPAQGIAGAAYFFQFSWIGSPEPIFEVSGYDGPFSYTNKGALFIPTLAEGTQSMTAVLRENLGDAAGAVLDTITWTITVSVPEVLTDATITSTSLAAVLFGDSNPKVPLVVGGSGPYTISVETGGLPSGLSLKPGLQTQAYLLDSFLEGIADQEGAGASVGLAVTGATGVKSATVTFASGITVNRTPTFVGITTIPQIPSNTPGAFDFAPFIRAYPAITGFTADPVLTTIHANLSKSGLTITYGDLTTIANSQTVPILFTLDSNGIGLPDTLVSTISVGVSAAPVAGVIASYDLSSYAAVTGAEIIDVPDLAQGEALPMSTALVIAGTTGPLWNDSSKAAEFRAGESIGIAVDVGTFPWAIGVNAKFKSTSPAGASEWMRSAGSYAYFNLGATGGARPVFLSSAPFTKMGTRSFDTMTYSPASAINAIVVKLGHSTVTTDIISSVTVNNGGAPVTLSRATAAADVTGEFARTYIYFLGAGIPAGPLVVTVNYASAVTAPVFVVVEGYTASSDVEIVNAPTPVQADAANPTITCDTTAGNRDCLATAMLGSGMGTLASITDGGSQTRQSAFTSTNGVRFDAATRNHRTNTNDPTTFTHTPVGTPKGVIIFILCLTTADHLVTATYGGVTIPSVDKRGNSFRHLNTCFLGAGLPAGAQTVSIDLDSATTDDFEIVVVTLTSSGGNTEIIDIEGLVSSGANTSLTMLTGGRDCTTFACGHFFEANVTDVVPNANLVHDFAVDEGSAIFFVDHQTGHGADNFVASWTHPSNFARNIAALAISEIVGTVGDMQFIASRQTTGGTADFPFAWTIASDDVALCAITMSEVEGSGAVMSLGSNQYGNSDAQTGVIDTQVRHILYAASATTGSYWKNGVKGDLTPFGAGNIAGNLKNIIFHGTKCEWDFYKAEVWKGTLSDGDATAMDARLNSDRTPPTPQPPNPPTNIVASAGASQVNLSWTPAPGAASVKIERSTVGGGSGFSEIVAGVGVSTYKDTTVTNGITYYFRFRSTNLGGDSAYSGEVNATPVAQAIGAPANNRVTNVTAGNVSHAWDAVTGVNGVFYKVYRGTVNGGPYTFISNSSTTTYNHTGLTNGTTYYMVVKASNGTVDSANSNQVTATPVSTTGIITKNFALMDGLMSADIPMTQHNALVQFEASGPTIQKRLFNSPAIGGGSDTAGHLAAGFPFVKRVSKFVPHLGANRDMFEMRIWDSAANTFFYALNNSIRATLACSTYDTAITVSQPWFYAFAFMVDSTMIQAAPLLSGFDHGFLGLHQQTPAGSTQLTPMSFFLDPTSATAMKLRITVRRHPFDNAQPGEQQFEETGAEILNIVPGKYYEVVYEYALGYWNSQNGYARAWLYEDGVARNSGNPFLDYVGRVGFNTTDTGFKHQRRIMAHYQWRGHEQFSQLAADNVANTPAGSRAMVMWVRKSLSCKGGTAGGVTATKDTLLNYLRLVEGAPGPAEVWPDKSFAKYWYNAKEPASGASANVLCYFGSTQTYASKAYKDMPVSGYLGTATLKTFELVNDPADSSRKALKHYVDSTMPSLFGGDTTWRAQCTSNGQDKDIGQEYWEAFAVYFTQSIAQQNRRTIVWGMGHSPINGLPSQDSARMEIGQTNDVRFTIFVPTPDPMLILTPGDPDPPKVSRAKIIETPAPFGEWRYFVANYRLDPNIANNPFIKIWMRKGSGGAITQVLNDSGPNHSNHPSNPTAHGQTLIYNWDTWAGLTYQSMTAYSKGRFMFKVGSTGGVACDVNNMMALLDSI